MTPPEPIPAELAEAIAAVRDLESDHARLSELVTAAADRARAARAGPEGKLRAAGAELGGLQALLAEVAGELDAARAHLADAEREHQRARLRHELDQATAEANAHEEEAHARFVAAYDAVRGCAADIVRLNAARLTTVHAATRLAGALGTSHGLSEHVRLDAHLFATRDVPRALDALVKALGEAVSVERSEAIQRDRDARRAARAPRGNA